jgi:hypothetical protein
MRTTVTIEPLLLGRRLVDDDDVTKALAITEYSDYR